MAIVGAGPAGLACALELERLGIRPAIYERHHRVGSPVERAEVLLELTWRPVKDQLAYLEQRCRLRLLPLARLQKIVMHSPGRRVAVSGRLGYIVHRGRAPASLECQLASRLRSPISFETPADPLELSQEFDRVVVATGDGDVASRLELWQEPEQVAVKGAVVLGDFDPRAASMWLDTRYAGHGFGHLVPLGRERASLHLCVGGIGLKQLDDYWNMFLEAEGLDRYPVVEAFEMIFHCGRPSRRQVKNLLLTGTAGGFVDNFLGEGVFASIVSGVLAARAIARGLDYESLVQPLVRRLDQCRALRRLLERLDDRGLERLLGLLNLPGLKQLIYRSGLNLFALWQAAGKRLTLAAPQAPQPSHQEEQEGQAELMD